MTPTALIKLSDILIVIAYLISGGLLLFIALMVLGIILEPIVALIRGRPMDEGAMTIWFWFLIAAGIFALFYFKIIELG